MTERNRKALCIVGAVLVIALAILVAAISADPTPTTPAARRLFGLWRLRHVAAVAALLGVAAYLLLASTGKKEHRFAYLGTLIVCGVFYGFLEVIGQIGIFSWSNIFRGGGSELGITRIPNVDQDVVSFQDAAMAWGLKSDPILFDFKSDAVGFRNDIDPRTADVVLIGDSFIQGPLIRQRELINNVLSEETGLKVSQAALLGLSPQAAQGVFWNAKIPPDGKVIVQFIFEGNDLRDSRAFESRKFEEFVEDPRAYAEPSYPLLANEIWRVLTAMSDSQQGLHGLDVCLIKSQPYTFQLTGWAIKGFESESENILRSLTEFAERIGDEGGEFLLVYIRSKLRVLAESCEFPEDSGIANVEEHLSPLREEVTKWAEMAGVPLLDLTGPLQRQARTGEIPWFWGDSHWNALGHAVAAREIAGWLPFRSAIERRGKAAEGRVGGR